MLAELRFDQVRQIRCAVVLTVTVQVTVVGVVSWDDVEGRG
jgi:hypothetical protein